MIYQVILVFI